jgi:hypothetical protein
MFTLLFVLKEWKEAKRLLMTDRLISLGIVMMLNELVIYISLIVLNENLPINA